MAGKFVKEIYEIKSKSGSYFEIIVSDNSKDEAIRYEDEATAYAAYIELCGEIYG